MAIFLDWFASHNTLVIQSLAAIVAMLIIFLIFRLLFASEATADGMSAKNVTYAQLEEKLNKLLEQQSLMKGSISAATDGAPAGETLSDDALASLSGDPASASAAKPAGNEQAAELSRLRAEISTLKDSVKRKEVEILDAKEQAQKSINTAQQDSKLNDLSGKITEYETEIDTLKTRLSDYEIIAEDIADLQRYKKENQELKNQLANAGAPVEAVKEEAAAPVAEVEPAPAPVAAAPVEEVEEAEAASELDDLLPAEEAAAAPEEAAVAEEPTPEPVAEEPDVPNDIFAAANDALDEAMPEPEPAEELDNEESREVSKDVKKEEKILLDEFEKHFAKDDD